MDYKSNPQYQDDYKGIVKRISISISGNFFFARHKKFVELKKITYFWGKEKKYNKCRK